MNQLPPFLQFPIIWSVLGVIIASGVFWIASRKLFQFQGIATQNLTNTLAAQIKAIEAERDDYREKLHKERDSNQAAQLRNKELESRPDLTTLEILLSDQKSWMKQLGDALQSHAEADAKIFGSINGSMDRVSENMGKVSNSLRGLALRIIKGRTIRKPARKRRS